MDIVVGNQHEFKLGDLTKYIYIVTQEELENTERVIRIP